MKETNLEKYGVDNPAKNEDIKKQEIELEKEHKISLKGIKKDLSKILTKQRIIKTGKDFATALKKLGIKT